MNTTTSPRTIRLIAARVNRGDSVDLFDTGEFITVLDIALVDGMVVVEYDEDSAPIRANALRLVDVVL
jgi:hypothetical protein